MVIKAIIILAFIYIFIEFFDYLTGIIAAKVNNTYKSHNAKVGAIKKSLVALTNLLFVIASIVLVKLCNILGYQVPVEISSVSGLCIVKAIITEFTSINENINKMKEGDKQ